ERVLIEPAAQDDLDDVVDPQGVLEKDVEVVLRLDVGDPVPIDLLEAIADAADDLVVEPGDDVEPVLIDELDVEDRLPIHPRLLRERDAVLALPDVSMVALEVVPERAARQAERGGRLHVRLREERVLEVELA